MKTEFTTTDIAAALKIPRERHKDWMIERFDVGPTVKARGAGTKAVYTIQDLYAISLFQNLLDAGFKRKEANEIVGIYKKRQNQKSDYLLIRYTEGDSEAYVDQSSDPGEGRLVVDLVTGSTARHDPKRGLVTGWGAPVEAHDPNRGGQDWDRIVAINLRRVRQRVDQAVSGL